MHQRRQVLWYVPLCNASLLFFLSILLTDIKIIINLTTKINEWRRCIQMIKTSTTLNSHVLRTASRTNTRYKLKYYESFFSLEYTE